MCNQSAIICRRLNSVQWRHFLFCPWPRRFACPLRGLWDCTEASKKRRRFGAEECFFSGGAADRRGGGQRSGPGPRRGKKMGESGKKACTKWENRAENGRRYEKGGFFPPFLCFLACNCCPSGHRGNGQAFSGGVLFSEGPC